MSRMDAKSIPKMTRQLTGLNWDEWQDDAIQYLKLLGLRHVIVGSTYSAERMVPCPLFADEETGSQTRLSQGNPFGDDEVEPVTTGNVPDTTRRPDRLGMPRTPCITEQEDAYVMLFIKENIADDLRQEVRKAPTAAAMWMQLEGQYKKAEQVNAATLLQEMLSFKQGVNEPVPVMNMRMQRIRKQLLSLNMNLD